VIKESQAANNETSNSRQLNSSELYAEDLIEAYIIPSDSALDNNVAELDTFIEKLNFTYTIDYYNEELR